ncbi:MAG TPA: hypothetical protein PLI27_04310 [Ignavibacteriales bacterium]|nr:hypothetical protein [Ignavibacteriales bacterium]HOL80554.1 hypothetical protein [Ignavibacteriales bacterium]HOM64243.1 hypothetical protein [Ignavibacteriales bacterium]HPD67283.1 hypothetical protein [Ignavibacteriales bacterium]HPP33111.1 hypothetical protein [Ignavibacteriales bacterium]
MVTNTITKTNTSTYGYNTSGQVNKLIGDQFSINRNIVSPITSTYNNKQDKSDSFIFYGNRPPKENINYNRFDILNKNKKDQTNSNTILTKEKTNTTPITKTLKSEDKSATQDKDKDKDKDKQNKTENNIIYQPPVPNLILMSTQQYERLKQENPYALKRLIEQKFRYNFPHAGVDLFM